MKPISTQKSISMFPEEELKFKLKALNFRFPIETLDSLLKIFFKEYENRAFLVQANKNIQSMGLRKIYKSFLLQVPFQNNSNEHLYIGLSDSFCFLILFDEPDLENQNIKDQSSKFFLTFDPIVISSIFDYFYKNYCKFLSVKEKKLLIKLKTAQNKEINPYYVSKFQEALLINALNDNNKAKYTKLVEALSFTDEVVILTDLRGSIKEANKNYQQHFEKNQKKSNVKELISDDLFHQAQKEVLKNGKWQSEISLNSLTGDLRLSLASCYLYKDELGRPNGFVFTFKDITSLKKLDSINKKLIAKLQERNLELSEINKRLLEANRIKTDLLSVVSHELKTPLSTIIGFSELIENREYDENTIKHFAEQITASAKQLDRLITDYLDVAVSQFGAKDGKLHTMPVNLAELIRNVFRNQQLEFSDVKFDFALDCLGYEPIIITEAVNIQKLFGNLINNCFKYSPNGGKIAVKILNDSENVTVSIKDEGVGLTVEQAKQVFEPFYRVDNSITRKFAGIGLGLAVCKRIVDLYSGSIWCEPDVDSGTVFYVRLPVNPSLAKKQEQKESYIRIDTESIINNAKINR